MLRRHARILALLVLTTVVAACGGAKKSVDVSSVKSTASVGLAPFKTLSATSVSPVLGLSFSPNDRRLAVVSMDGTLVVHDLQAQRVLWKRDRPGVGPTFKYGQFEFQSLGLVHGGVTFSPDGKWLTVGGPGRDVVLRDARSGELLSWFALPEGERSIQDSVGALSFSQNGRFLTTVQHLLHPAMDLYGGPEGMRLDVYPAFRSLLLRVDSRGRMTRFRGPESESRFLVAGPPRDAWKVSARTSESGQQVLFYREKTGRRLGALDPEGSQSVIAVVGQPGRKLALATGNGEVYLWSEEVRRQSLIGASSDDPVISLSLLEKDTLLAVGNRSGMIRIFDAREGTQRRAFPTGSRLTALSGSTASGVIAAGDETGRVRLWRVR